MNKIIIISTIACLSLGLFLPMSVQGQEVYEPIVEIPNIDANSQNPDEYVRALYLLSITAAALLAVIKIIFGGVKWMLSDVVTDKSAAVKDIRGALFGLLIVLGAVLILGTINPTLLNLNFLSTAPALEGFDVSGPENEAPPLIDAEIGDSLDASSATDEQGEHFKDTCPGTVNIVHDASGKNSYYCEEEADEVSSIQLSCSGATCTCGYGQNGNRSLCVARCQTAARDGYNFIGVTDTSNTSISCQYSVASDPSTCASTPFKSCQTNFIGGPLCDVNPALVCAQTVNGPTTFFYGFE